MKNMKNIITNGPLDAPPIDGPSGVTSQNIGDQLDATPIEGHEVELKVTRDEVTSNGESGEKYR